MSTPSAPIDRASANDLLQRATDVGSVPMQVGAVLVLDDAGDIDLPAVRDAIERRTRAIPRLRRRLVDAPFGCGRPYWVDDADFAIERHVRALVCPRPGDEAALLAVATAVATERLPDDRPLWSVTFVTGLESGAGALFAVFHHVLADGIGGLAVLAGLVDGAPDDLPARQLVTSQPGRRRLFGDATRARLQSLARVPSAVGLLRATVGELRRSDVPKAARCSLNRPTGPRRSLATARVDLAPVVDVAHRHGATVNDIVLTAVAGALQATLHRRGEGLVPEFVITVPVSGRRATSATELGNDVSMRPVVVPALGEPAERLVATARRRPAPGDAASAASVALLGPLFRLLAALRLFRWFTERQRLVHTFVTNLRGPTEHLAFLGAQVRDVIPVSSISGNVTVAFAVLSYAGTLVVTVVADSDAWPDLASIQGDLQTELDVLVCAAQGR